MKHVPLFFVSGLGGRCANTTVCTNHIPNSICGVFSPAQGFGNCVCPRQGDLIDPGAYYGPPGTTSGSGSSIQNAPQTLLPSIDGQTCMPTMCPPPGTSGSSGGGGGTATMVNPCRGDSGFYQCNNKTGGGYQCDCTNGARGRSSNLTTPGICCSTTKINCLDFSMCIDASKMCDGVADCPDCSDEKFSICSSQWPQVPQCGPPQRSLGEEETRSLLAPPDRKENRAVDLSQLKALFSDKMTFPSGKSFSDLKVVNPKEQPPA